MKAVFVLMLVLMSINVGRLPLAAQVPGTGANMAHTLPLPETGRTVQVTIDDVPVRIDATPNTWIVGTAGGKFFSIYREGDRIRVRETGAASASPADHRVTDPGESRRWEINGKSVTIGTGGQLRLGSGETIYRGRTLIDASPVVYGEYMAALIEPSEEYRHGILGDGTEARGFIIWHSGTDRVIESKPLPDGTVFEARYPILADLTGDDVPELIITAANARSGARLQVYGMDGRLKAESDPVGRGYRWIHLLGVARPAPEAAPEILAVKTPHIGGVLEYYRLDGSRLIKTRSVPGFSTHMIRSRNLDMYAIGSMPGTPRSVVLLPTTDYRRLSLMSVNTEGTVELMGEFDLEDRLTTNIAIRDGGDVSELAWGTDSGIISITTSRY